MPQFRSSDRVVVIEKHSYEGRTLTGLTGTITNVVRSGDQHNVAILLDEPEKWFGSHGGKVVAVPLTWIEHTSLNKREENNVTDFKVGDKIVGKGTGSLHRDLVGETAVVQEVGNLYMVIKLDHPERWFKSNTYRSYHNGVRGNLQVVKDNWELAPQNITDDVMHYLSRTDGSTAERKKAIVDLTQRGFFHEPQRAQEIIEQYLDDNPSRFCAQGIDRFRKALNLEKKLPERSPLSEDALKLEELKFGDVFELTGTDGSERGTFVFLNETRMEPVFGYKQCRVIRINKTPGEYNSTMHESGQWKSCADMGLIPKEARWSDYSYCRWPVGEDSAFENLHKVFVAGAYGRPYSGPLGTAVKDHLDHNTTISLKALHKVYRRGDWGGPLAVAVQKLLDS